MKIRFTLLAAAMALSGAALAADETNRNEVGSDIRGSGTEGSAETIDSGETTGTDQVQARDSGLLSVIDTDGDGKVSRDEWTSHFQQHDTDNDGSLDQSEFAAFEDAVGGGTQIQQDQQVSPDSSGDVQQTPSDMITPSEPTRQ